MKREKIQDERIIFQKQKIGSDAFGIVFFGLLISVLLQQFVFEATFSQYAAEFILFVVAAIYIIVRNIMVGIDLFGDSAIGQKTVILNCIVTGITIATITTTLNTINFGLEKMGGVSGVAMTAIITFVSGALITFIGFELLYLINKKRQKHLDDKYDDKEE